MATFSPRPTEFEFPWFDTRSTYDQSLEAAINAIELSASAQFSRVLSSGAPPNFNTTKASGELRFLSTSYVIVGKQVVVIPANTFVDLSPFYAAVTQIIIFFDPITSSLYATSTGDMTEPAPTKDLLIATVTDTSFSGRIPWMNGMFTEMGTKPRGSIQDILFATPIPRVKTTPSYTGGQVTALTHTSLGGSTILRVDTFEYTATTITETRRHPSSEETLTLTTNLNTLITEVS